MTLRRRLSNKNVGKAVCGLRPGGGQRKARLAEVRDALLRAGGGDFEKAGQSVVAAFSTREFETFLKPLACGLAKIEPLTEAFAKELREEDRDLEPPLSAVAQAAQSLNWGRRRLKKAGVKVGWRVWKGVEEKQKVAKHQVKTGAALQIGSFTLVAEVKSFLKKRNAETSRFLRTKTLHRKAGIGDVVIGVPFSSAGWFAGRYRLLGERAVEPKQGGRWWAHRPRGAGMGAM